MKFDNKKEQKMSVNCHMHLSSWTLIVWLSLACFCCGRVALGSLENTPTCRDENGDPVDWFIVYKFPVFIDQPQPFRTGAGYAYITDKLHDEPDSLKGEINDDETFVNNFKRLINEHLGVPLASDEKSAPGWTIGKYPIHHENSMVLRSLAPAYSEQRPESLDWIFYNDQPPKPQNGPQVGQSSARAHSKGSILIDNSSGNAMWLTHSVSSHLLAIPFQKSFELLLFA